MTINLKMPHPEPDLKPRITVVGVGGAGGNAVNNMIENDLGGVEFVVTNTDAQALAQSNADRKIQLGRNITQGLGAGSRPDVGRAAAEEAIEEIIEQVQQSNMVFITAGMGGGTGTGAAPVVARAAREQGILTVGVVTKPFQFEGLNRMRIAEEGMTELQHYVDTLIIIPNQNLFRIATDKTTFAQAFEMADDVLYSGVRGVTDLMVMPGLINLDFADVRQVMSEMGKAMMGTGEAEGESRATAAAEAAISNPLLDDVSMEGAKGVLINITGGYDMTLFEVDEAANRIRSEVDPEANIIFGSTFEEKLDGRMRISVIATGIEADSSAHPKPLSHISLVSDNTPSQRSGAGAPAGAPTARQSEPVQAADHKSIDEVPVFDLEADVAMPEKRMQAGGGRGAFSIPDSAPAGDDSFLPPPPVEVRETPETTQANTARAADPLAEAELVNAGLMPAKRAPSRRKGPSLFERVTGTGRARSERAQKGGGFNSGFGTEPRFGYGEDRPAAPVEEPPAEGPEQPIGDEPAGEDRSVSSLPPQPEPRPRLDSAPSNEPSDPEPEPEEKPAAKAPSGKRPAQADLGDLEPKGSLDKDVQEDLLEIPAFLRRQAN
ncbi:MAG TPA: cell division protein FtsZ [Alphaproteobacteria bacterium]|nr:cell division protein FtsZ [Alphaproteobacteria bacterium]